MFQLILFEGMTHSALGEHDTDRALHHNNQARIALEQFAPLAPTLLVPERSKIEIINQQARAAIETRNMEEFEYFLLAGATRSKALGSQKRIEEVHANWRIARKAWPHETRVLKLADALI